MLPVVYPVLLSMMPTEVTEEIKIQYPPIECLLYTFHQTASRVPGFLHTLCGIRINTGQPECKLDEDHTEKLADLKLRLKVLSSQANDFIKKLQQVEAKLGQTKAEDDAAKKELATKKSACKQSQVTCPQCRTHGVCSQRGSHPSSWRTGRRQSSRGSPWPRLGRSVRRRAARGVAAAAVGASSRVAARGSRVPVGSRRRAPQGGRGGRGGMRGGHAGRHARAGTRTQLRPEELWCAVQRAVPR